ncbi:hypothetical protein GF407_03055 [candidate division KSB1 bacterium]|nr:hypothetical protein [candidate division KSB1 bacterium]
MNRFLQIILINAMLMIFASTRVVAQTESNENKAVENKKVPAYNPKAPDHDGDGIPNGQDPDYQRKAGQSSVDKNDAGQQPFSGEGEGDTGETDPDTGSEVDLQSPNKEQLQNRHSQPNGFVDENGDGLNDNAPDADGDGIPNGQDEDYEPPRDGRGWGRGHGMHGFIDEDGDGFNDNVPAFFEPDGKKGGWQRPEECFGRGARAGQEFGREPGKAGPGGPAGKGKGPEGGKGGE